MFKELFTESKKFKIYYSGDTEGSIIFDAKDAKDAEKQFKDENMFKKGVSVVIDDVELQESEINLDKNGKAKNIKVDSMVILDGQVYQCTEINGKIFTLIDKDVNEYEYNSATDKLISLDESDDIVMKAFEMATANLKAGKGFTQVVKLIRQKFGMDNNEAKYLVQDAMDDIDY